MAGESVRVRPEDLDHFRQTLQVFNVQVDRSVNRIQAQLDVLGNEWRDAEYGRFAGEFTISLQHFKSYLQSADARVAELRRKLEALEEFRRR
jgi:uncharacterized protein YukE